MAYDMEFKVLSEQHLKYFQFKAHQIFQELKEQQQWEFFCKQNGILTSPFQLDSVSRIDYTKTVPSIKSKVPEQGMKTAPNVKNVQNIKHVGLTNDISAIKRKLHDLELIICNLKCVQHHSMNKAEFNSEHRMNQNQTTMPFRKGKTTTDVKWDNRDELNNDINAIKLKLDSLELIMHNSKSIQHQSKKDKECDNENVRDQNRTIEPSLQIDRNRVFQNALLSAYKKLSFNETSKPKYTNSSFLLPEPLRVQRALARLTYKKSNPPKPVKRNECISKNKIASNKTLNQKNLRPNLKGKLAKLTAVKPKMLGSPKELSKGKKVRIVTKETVEKSTESIALKQNDEELNQLEKRITDIESIENTIQERLNTLKATVKPDVSKDGTNLEKEKSEEDSEVLPLSELMKDVNQWPKSVEKLATLPSSFLVPETHPKQLSVDFQTTKSPTFHPEKIDVSISPNSLRSIYHHRKLFRRYLRNTAHREVDSFNPWSLANTISDYLIEDCIEHVAQEIEKIPSSFVMDLYNREFSQSIF